MRIAGCGSSVKWDTPSTGYPVETAGSSTVVQEVLGLVYTTMVVSTRYQFVPGLFHLIVRSMFDFRGVHVEYGVLVLLYQS